MYTKNSQSDAGMLRDAVLGWLCIALLFITLNTSSVFYQAFGSLPEAAPSAGLAAFFLGIAITVLILPGLERTLAESGLRGKLARAALLPILLSPTVLFVLVLPRTPDMRGAFTILSYAQLFLAGMMPPMAMRVFSRNVPVSSQAFFFGLAMGIAYGYWALLMPLLGDARAPLELTGKRWLFLLYSLRLVTGTALAAVIWRLLPKPAGEVGMPAPAVSPDAEHADGGFLRSVFFLLLPLALACVSSGLSGYQLSFRLLTRGGYPEYIPLALGLLFPLAGALVSEKGEKGLRMLLFAGTLCFATSPLLASAAKGSVVYLGAYISSLFGYQMLVFGSMVACARLAERSGRPVPTMSLAWLVACAILPSAFFARSVLDAWSLSPDRLIWGLGACALLSLVWLGRAFPLLPADSGPQSPEPERASAPRRAPASELQAFVDRHQLSRREREILELLLKGRSTEDMAAALGLKESSVRRYVNSLLQKTGSGSRLELVAALAFRDGLEPAPSSAQTESDAPEKPSPSA